MSRGITDTHIHIWNLERVRYSWLDGNTTVLNQSYGLDEVLPHLGAAGVDQGILVQAANSLEDTELMLEEATHHPWIKGVVGWVPLLDPDATGRALEYYKSKSIIKGFRHLVHDEPNTKWLLQERVIESLKLVADQGYTYDVVGTKLDHIKCVLTLSTEVPNLKMVFDHLNQPPFQQRAMGEWGSLMQEAAQNPNVFAKISGLGLASGREGWKSEHLRPFISFALHTYGPERCMCGGDWPVALLAGEYVYTWQQYHTVLESLLKGEKLRAVYSDTASNFYNL